MNLYSIEEATLVDITDAIKEKTGDEQVAIAEVSEKIRSLPDDTLDLYFQKALTEISPRQAASIQKTESYQFADQKELRHVPLFPNITSLGQYTFSGCTSLESIEWPEQITSVPSYCFRNCTSLKYFDFNKVKSVSTDAFAYSGLEEAISENQFGYVLSGFENCTNLKKVNFQNTTSTSIPGSFFNNCPNLEEVTLSDKITSISERAFYGCNKLKSINFFPSLTTINNYAFYYAGNSSESGFEFIFPETLKTINTYAFQSSGIKQAIIPDSVTTIGDQVFTGCMKLKKARWSSGTKTVSSHAFSSSSLEEVELPEGVTTISSRAFSGCTKLNKFNLPSTLKTLYSDAFNSCPLEDSPIIIPSGVTSIPPYCFRYNNSPQIHFTKTLTSISDYGLGDQTYSKLIDNPNTGVFVDSMDTFYNLWNASYPSYLLYGRKYLYVNGERITDLVYPSTSARGVFGGFHGHSLDLKNITSWGFLGSFVLDEFETPAKSISTSSRLFDHRTHIKKFILNPSFSNNSNSMLFGNSSDYTTDNMKIDELDLSKATTIPKYMFQYVNFTNGVTIPENITSIGAYSFKYGCTFGPENTIIMKGETPPSISQTSLGYHSTTSRMPIILIPVGSYNAYATATNWSSYYKSKLKEDPRAGIIYPDPLPIPTLTKEVDTLIVSDYAHATSATIEYSTSLDGEWLPLIENIPLALNQSQTEIGYSAWWYAMNKLNLDSCYVRAKTHIVRADDSASSETIYLSRPGSDLEKMPTPYLSIDANDLCVLANDSTSSIILFWRKQSASSFQPLMIVEVTSSDVAFESGSSWIFKPEAFSNENLSASLKNTNGGPASGEMVELQAVISGYGYANSDTSNTLTFQVA